MPERKSLITCGIINFTLFFPFINPFFCFCDFLLITNVPEEWLYHTYIKMLGISLGQTLAGGWIEVYLALQKKKKVKKIPTSIYVNINLFSFSSVNPKKKEDYLWNYLLIFIAAFLDYFSMTGIFYQLNWFPSTVAKITSVFVQIIFVSILCILFLKLTLHFHHFLAFMVILVGYIIVVISGAERLLNEHQIWQLLCCICFYLLFSVREVIEKHGMEVRHISPFLMLFWAGVFGIFASLIQIGVFSNYKCEGFLASIRYCHPGVQTGAIASFDLFRRMFTDQIPTYWNYLLLIVSGGLFNVFAKLTNYHFSPVHRAVPDILSCVCYMLCFELIKFEGVLRQASQIFGYIILFFGALTYTEFLIVNICGLSKDTKVEILKRIQHEDDLVVLSLREFNEET